MAGRSITFSTGSVGKTAKTRDSAPAADQTRKREVRPGKTVAKTAETHRGSAADILSAFAELYRQL
jgi:hypothetical protein